MLPARCVILVNADFESRRGELSSDGPRGYEADAAVLDTAREVQAALRTLGVEVEELRVTASLRGVATKLRQLGADVVFNLVESIDNDYGREWQVPQLLERHDFAYTGNGVTPLRLCRAKDQARKVLERAGVRVPRGVVLRDGSQAAIAQVLRSRLTFPAFVKPARVDGSIGIDADSRVLDAEQLAARVRRLTESSLPGPFLVEEYLPGKEINVSIFPGPAAGFVVPTEIDFSPVPAHLPRFITYDSKWNPESPEFASKSVPAELSSALRDEVDSLARRAFLALGGSGYGRVDMRLDGEGRPCVIDVNPNNDIHPDAGLVTAAKSVGWSYPQLLAGVLERAIEARDAARAARNGAKA
jgi:D-alanine-D-alanine ligase